METLKEHFIKYPELEAQFSTNNESSILDSSVRSNVKAYWNCSDCGTESLINVSKKTAEPNYCPVCVGYVVVSGVNDFKSQYPVLASFVIASPKELDTITKSSGMKATWVCKMNKEHTWEAQVSAMTRGEDLEPFCPSCAYRQSIITKIGEENVLPYGKLVPKVLSENFVETVPPGKVLSYTSKKMCKWICTNGHTFQRSPKAYFNNQSCPECSNQVKPLKLVDVYPELETMWHSSNTALFSEVSIWNSNVVKFVCSQGHEWEESVKLFVKKKGSCPYCSNRKTLTGFNDVATVDPELAHKFLNSREARLYRVNSSETVSFVCSLGHTYERAVTVEAKLSKVSCPYCNGISLLEGFNDLLTFVPNIHKFWSKKNEMTPNMVLRGSEKNILHLECELGHEWTAYAYMLSRKHDGDINCPKCYTSSGEKSLLSFIEQNYTGEIITNSRKVIAPSELDIFLPELKLAFEFNGIYWHSEKFAGKDKHYKKWSACTQQSIQLIQIWEDDWLNKSELVKSMILHKLKLSEHSRVYGRKTRAVTVPVKDATVFLDSYHMQGSPVGVKHYGLVESDKLVAVMSIKVKASSLEVVRYATSAVVVGGFSKLLKHVETEHKPETIETFADHCVSDGSLYEMHGFSAEKVLQPDYKYLVGNQLVHKSNYRKKRFRDDDSLLYVDGASETELASLNGLVRVWDAGKTKYVKKL